MAQSRRRVSYVIPPPTEPVLRLQLPSYGVSRIGLTGPLLLPIDSTTLPSAEEPHRSSRTPRHRLGVSSLALDCSTQLTGRNAPEGILYSGGRDGQIMSWDLHIPMKKRAPVSANDMPRSRWEMMTGWGDDEDDEDEDEERVISDGDVLGEVTAAKRQKNSTGLPYEQQWETDIEAYQLGQPSTSRQCAYMQTDWINDIALCNYNQTVVSASSDGTVKAWNPHSQQDPSIIGTHSDYVRCLAPCREQNWVASGSFDRTIKLWDLSRLSHSEALVTLNPADASAPKSSVYAIAADPFGHAVASGTPERVIRLWDPRSGKRTGKLVGHTDNIRAILISEDSKYLLTGSADASIKLWSLSSQRCLHTFEHHTDSVWSLFSSHPSLETFYSGDRTGLVCRVDVEDCTGVSEGECILLCRDTQESSTAEGVNKIVAMDDNLVWTASGSSTIRRWKVPHRRATRANASILDSEDRRQMSESPTGSSLNRDQSVRSSTSFHSDHLSYHDKDDRDMLFGVPFESLVRLTSPNDTFYSSRGRDPEVATLYSAASVMSVPRTNMRSPTNFSHGTRHHHLHSHGSPLRSPKTDDTVVLEMPPARLLYEERELAADAQPLNREPDSVIGGDNGFVRSIVLNDRVHALTVDISGEVAVWDIVRCICAGKYSREDVATASMRGSRDGSDSGRGEREHSPREALESVRERIEGEAVVLPWAAADTKGGLLTIHLNEKCFDAEVYADEVGFAHDRYVTDESKRKWVLRNLFLAFIREEQRMRRKRDRSNSRDSGKGRRDSTSHENRRSLRSSSVVISSPKMLPAVAPAVAMSSRSSPLLTPMIPLNIKDVLPAIPQSPNDATPMPGRMRSGTWDSSITPTTNKDIDYFSVARRPSVPSPPTPDEFSGWSGPGIGKSPDSGQQTPITPSGIMGRIVKNFKGTKKSANDTPVTPAAGQVSTIPEASTASEDSTSQNNPQNTALQTLLSGPLSPPPSSEAPIHSLPNHITLLISEETSLGYRTVYRGTVNSAGHDVHALEEAMPMWLIEYLLTNKTTTLPPLVKISFILLPHPNKDPSAEQLPELLNITQSKLTASRWLRVRKLVNHVQDKLDKINNPGASSKPNSPRSSIEGSQHSPRPKAEDLYEILCNDIVLPLDMTLAAVRQYVWRQSSELTMYYRAKPPSKPIKTDPSIPP
ncbi:hypothetical protein D9758_007423 [Tetrapyrgos nigripes]|uniref:WD40 repeat-like protein n=1 Tax=Tetrapyrgos nigripes TaxID=182062 RepID=A0A8H5G3K0_9AGAR|nr:hypothetical protein D9758_007423 [Tetrapyrgos nigripes]